MKQILGLMAAAVILASGATASATNVNFSSFSPTGTPLPTISVDGFNFNDTSDIGYMGVFPGSPNDSGAPLIFNPLGAGLVEVDEGGTPFTLNNLDMTLSWYDANPTDTVIVVGNVQGGGIDSTVLTLGQGLQEYDLNWTNLTAFGISGVVGGVNSYWALDNLDVNGGVVTPEPGTWLLMGSGLLGLALIAIRRRWSARNLTATNLA